MNASDFFKGLREASSEIIIRCVIVTAEVAERWLGRMAPNRSLSAATVNKLVREIEANRWQLTGTTIQFDPEGWLIDGQHRLAAMVKTGRSAKMFVAFGVSREAMLIIDTNRGRQLNDLVSIYLGENSKKSRIAVARMMGALEAEGDRTIVLSASEVLDVIARHPGVDWVVAQAGGRRGNSPLMISPILVAFAIAFEKYGDAMVEEFEAFVSGADLKAGDPFLTFRNYLTSPAGVAARGGGSTIRVDLLKRSLTAIAYRMQGKSLRKSYVSEEGFRHFGVGNPRPSTEVVAP